MAVKDQHTLPFFYEPAKQLAKEFAMKLFTHVNPYTGLSYAEDPAVAFVEILNEYGITFGWLNGAIDRLPKVFRDALRERWNDFLIAKYDSTENLRKSWGIL
jgi:beta-galactosidase GanA